MLAEAVAAALVGVLALFLVLRPLFSPPDDRPAPAEPLDPEETPKGVALTALKEIEFDRETGKLSDADYELLKRKYTAAALAALRAEEQAAPAPADVEAMIAARVNTLRSAATPAPAGVPACPSCGPRPEAGAAYCSTCGRRLQAAGACDRCGAPLSPESRFCEGCGTRVAA
jgi:hypothetical protein